MNFVHLHLLLNHFPIIGTLVGLGLLLISLVRKKRRPQAREPHYFLGHGSAGDSDVF